VSADPIRRACCASWLGDAHEAGCYAPLRALFARARLECRDACLLHDDESAPLDAPRGMVSAEAVRLAHLLDGATDALRRAEGTALWAGVHRSYRARAVCLVEELRACQAAGRVAA
jgi:hypothetical protein